MMMILMMMISGHTVDIHQMAKVAKVAKGKENATRATRAIIATVMVEREANMAKDIGAREVVRAVMMVHQQTTAPGRAVAKEKVGGKTNQTGHLHGMDQIETVNQDQMPNVGKNGNHHHPVRMISTIANPEESRRTKMMNSHMAENGGRKKMIETDHQEAGGTRPSSRA